jgi:acetyltransferase-like isoleucine patch superfamily enzyme
MIKEIFSALSFFLPSLATCIIFRLLGHKIGKNVKMPILTYVSADEIEIGNDVDIRPFVFIRVNKLLIGNNSIISFGTQIKGDKNFFIKGNNFIGSRCLINCEEDVKMGFYSGLGPRCMVYTHGSFLPITKGYPVKFKEIVIEDYVWIAMAVTILPGTYVESNCIINPGVVLKSRIKSNTLIELKPAIFSEINLNKLQRFHKKSNLDYHRKIIDGFLTYCQMDYTHNEEDKNFSAGEKYVFKYSPETDTIELNYDKNKKITYDLGKFCTDYSKQKIHKKFLFFLRRRCGITLRTNYSD